MYTMRVTYKESKKELGQFEMGFPASLVNDAGYIRDFMNANDDVVLVDIFDTEGRIYCGGFRDSFGRIHTHA